MLARLPGLPRPGTETQNARAQQCRGAATEGEAYANRHGRTASTPRLAGGDAEPNLP